MNLNKYQELASRTANPHDLELLNYGLGLAGEAGEIVELIKKSHFHGHVIDKTRITGELGDLMWYVSQVARVTGIDLEDVGQANIEKLKKRYPNGFSEKDSQNRTT